MGWYKAIRIILILIPIIALGYFGYQYANPSGELIINYDFCEEETPYFSGLSPHGRVLDLVKSEIRNPKSETNCFQRMVIDPVYFDVRLPQSYQAVEIEAQLDKTASQEFNIGVGLDPDDWKWSFNLDDSPTAPGALYSTSLNLEEDKFENQRYRFIVSAPGLDTRPLEVKFYNIKLTFKKPHLSRENFRERLRSLFGV